MKKKKKILICLIITILVVAFSIMYFELMKNFNLKKFAISNNELKKAMTYDQVIDDISMESTTSVEPEIAVKYGKGITGNGFANIYDVKSTKDGGYVVVGSYLGELDVDSDKNIDATSDGNNNQLIIKYDSNGNMEWFKSFGTDKDDEFNSVDATSDNGYIVSGYENGDGVTMKLDNSGNEVWKKTVGGIYEDETKEARVLKNGDIIAVGKFASPTININNTTITRIGKNNGYIICYDANGNYKWHKAITGTGDIVPTSITETSHGIAVAINYLETINIDGNAITNEGYQDAVIVAFSEEGTYQWNKKIGGSNDESISKVVTDSNDNIVAVGCFASNLTIDTETINCSTEDYSNSIVLKFASTTGDYISSKVLDQSDRDDKIITATPIDDGAILLGGWYSYDKKYENGFVAKLNDQNEIEWSRAFGDESFYENYGITQLSNKTIVAVGGYDGRSLSFANENNLLSSQGYSDGYIINMVNNIRDLKITAKIAMNSDYEITGGTITGTFSKENRIYFVENVEYGHDSTIPIVITPETNYEISYISINGEKIDFKPDSNGVVTLPIFTKVRKDKYIEVSFEKKKSSVIVHHYIKDKDGNYTTTQVAEDEHLTGKIGSSYQTSPKENIEKYELEKDAEGNDVLPSNTKGTYTQTETIVTYYYQKIKDADLKPELTVKYSKKITGNGLQNIYDIESTKDGGYVVVGSFLGESDINGDGNVDVTSRGGFDQLIAKYDSDGNVEWFKNFGTHLSDEFNSIDIASDGGYVVSGHEGLNQKDAIVMKLDSSGNEVWKKTIGGIYEDKMRDAKVLLNGDIVAVGRFTSPTININNTTITKNGNSNGFIICYDTNGNYKWHKEITGTGNIDPTSITETSHGIVVSINYLEAINIDEISITNAGKEDSVIVAFSTDGTYQWNQKISGKKDEVITKVITDNEDNIVAVGGFASEITIGTAKIDSPSTSYGSNLSSIVLKLTSATGDYISNKAFAGIENDDKIMAVTNTADGGILIGGYFCGSNYNNCDIDGDGNNDIPDSKNRNDAIIIKLNKQNKVEWYRIISGTEYDENYGVAQLSNKTYIAVGGFDSATLSYGDQKNSLNSQEYADGYIIDFKYVNGTKDTSVLVHHYIKDTTTKLSEDVIINGEVDNDYTTTTANDIPEYYELVAEPDNKAGKMTEEQIVVNYYYQLKKYPYTVNYLEKDTNKVLHPAKTDDSKEYGTTINTENEKIDIDEYNYDSADKETLTIGTGENVINIYYTKKSAKVTVHYYEENTTNKVSEDVEINGKVSDDYNTTEANDIPSKYKLVAEPDNKSGKMTENEIVVIYYYRKKASKVIVHYYEQGTTNKLSEDKIINGKVDDNYSTESAYDIPAKYVLVAEPENKTGTMTEDTIEVIYYYQVKEAVVNVRYLEKGTDKTLADLTQLKGKVDEEYQTVPKEIEGYQLVEHIGNEKGKYEEQPLTVTYYYLYKTKATVQYIDKTTGKIIEQSTTEGLEGDDFVTESKTFENYVLVEEPKEKTVKMTKDEIILKYYYIHVSGGVIEKHIDEISGEVLANEVHEGKEGDQYDIKSRTFEGYDLVEDKLPTNAKGTMKAEATEVIYYYIYKTKVTAEYIDKITGNKLTEDKVQTGHEKDTYTTERKTFDNYKLVEVPANADGEMTKEDITVTYNYVHTSGGVVVNHIDAKTGEQLLEETKIEGYEGDPYETQEANIPGYKIVEEKRPTNAKGTMTVGEIRVTYYYSKKSGVTVKYVDKETGKEIETPTEIEGHEGEKYKIEAKEIEGYDIVEEPENKEGTMINGMIEVIYYYRRPAKVVINYYDENNKKIADEIIIKGHQNDKYETEPKDIKYYIISKTAENKTGTMEVKVTKDESGKEQVEDTTYVNYYYRQMVFNMKVDKTVSSIIIDGKEQEVNGDLGKAEIPRKELSIAKVQVKYKIAVTNDSELTGKAVIIEDIPNGMTMKAENNTGWEIKGTTATKETEEMKPGETQEYDVVLDWNNGENNIGMKENTATITTQNEAGFEEKDTTDNEDKADIIVAVGTGEVPYVLIAGMTLMVVIAMAVGVYRIQKDRNKGKHFD